MNDLFPPDKVTYEHPLSERMRAFFRLEQLFHHVFYLLKDLSSVSSRQMMMGFIDILETTERFDVKGELIKELERLVSNFGKFRLFPTVDQEKLLALSKKSEQLIQKLQMMSGKIGGPLLENPLLNSVRQRMAIAGGPSPFDLPAYHHWLQRPSDVRGKVFSNWLSSLEPIYAAITLILKCVRESAATKILEADQGFYQQTLNPQNPYQCVRIFLPLDAPCFPEISAGRHQIHIRFYTLSERGESVPIQDKLPFEMACCLI